MFKRWLSEAKAVAAMESALIFPILMTLLFGVVDVGTGVMINTKVNTATQLAADLLARQNMADNDDIQEARLAAEAALMPYFEASNFGIDIAGIQFDGEEAIPTERWRDTVGMNANTSAVGDADGLGLEDEGVVIVTVQYTYTPRFGEFITGDMVMREVAFVKGRDSSFVGRN